MAMLPFFPTYKWQFMLKASINLKSKSLKVFQEKYDLTLRVRISLAPFERNGNILNMPLYALHCFKHALKLVVS